MDKWQELYGSTKGLSDELNMTPNKSDWQKKAIEILKESADD